MADDDQPLKSAGASNKHGRNLEESLRAIRRWRDQARSRGRRQRM
jgi:hypothetical protein